MHTQGYQQRAIEITKENYCSIDCRSTSQSRLYTYISSSSLPQYNCTSYAPTSSVFRGLRLLLGGGGTSNNLDELTGNDGLASTVEQNLELGDHLAGVLGGVVHGVAAGGLLASVTLGKSPEEGVGKSVLAKAGENGLVDLEGREVG